MLPTQVNYPEFVPDQLLTSAHLNQLFGYLEEQGRLTRTNLIGIGIVCGLEVKTNAGGTAITITKGCGVTSEGYLVAIPEITYTSSKPFNAVQERIYAQFVDGSKNPRFDILELKQAAVEEGTTPLSAGGLTNKVVLIFVEILEEGAKNCNPNSCDDKGVNVTVTFRPLLIDKEDADSMGEGNLLPKNIVALPDLRMRRYDVLATDLRDSAAIFTAYQKVLDAAFLDRAEQTLTQAFTAFAPLLIDLYAADPFQGLAAHFKFLNNGTINGTQLLNIQYYYDLFSDLVQAYEELRKTGMELISACCPDSNLFPRHLFLDLALPDTSKQTSDYRHYFIPSPILQQNPGLVKELRSLFKRMVLLLDKFYLPPVAVGGGTGLKRGGTDENIRITPSKYGEAYLSEKAIPFYYRLVEGPDRLLMHWSFKKSVTGRAEKNLSYHAEQYNAADEEVLKPLLYDLESYNFLRIEGHLGKPYTDVLRNILLQKRQNRLPFEVIALSTDVVALRTQIRGLASRTAVTGLPEINTGQDLPQCQFQDLESLYDTLAAELTCSLCKEMKYFYDTPGNNQLPAPASTVPQVPLLVKCDPNFRFTANTTGHLFELFYATVKDQPYVNSSFFLNTVLSNTLAAAAVNTSNNIALGLLYYMEKLSETLEADLSDFDIAVFNTRYNDLLSVAGQIRTLLRGVRGETGDTGLSEDVLDHLDALIFACKQVQFTTLHKDYLARWIYVMMLQKFGYFLQMHPGIQHKAGVTVGGTFILVYHEAKEERGTDAVAAVPGSRTAVAKGEVLNDSIRKIMAADTAAGKRKAKDSLSDKKTEMRKKTAAETVAPESIAAAPAEESERLIRKAVAGNKTSGSRQLEYLENVLLEAVKTDKTLDPLIAEIDNGTVIADFFLPYLCYSDCPPVHYILPEEKEPEEPVEPVTITIGQTDYCSADKTAFPIEVSPEGGSVSGEGVKSVNGKFTFYPAGVDLQGNKQKEVVVTYTRDGQSDSKTLVVHQTPTALFTVVPSKAVNRFTFKNESKFADSFEWEFGDGATSTEENPAHAYEKEGSYEVSLVVVNGTCRSAKAVTKVDVKKNTVPQLDCLPVGGLVEEFTGLEKLDPNVFPEFRKNFQLYGQVDEFFKKLADLVTAPAEEQLKFFLTEEIQVKLPEWLNVLSRLMRGGNSVLLAYTLYRILVRLAMYIHCIQKEDIGEARVNMSAAFKLIQEHLRDLKALAEESAMHKDQLKKLMEAFNEELKRIVRKDKPDYFTLINNFVNSKE